MVAVVSHHWLVSRHWCRYPLDCWMLRFRGGGSFFLPSWCCQERVSLSRLTLPGFWTRLFLRKQLPLLVSHGFSKASWKHWRMNRMRCVIKKKARIMEAIGSFKVFWCWWGIYQCGLYRMGQASWSSGAPWTLIWQKSEVRFDPTCWISIQILIVWLFPQDRYSV